MTWQEAAMGMIAVALTGVIFASLIYQVGSNLRARSSSRRETEYRSLAESALQLHQYTAQRLDEVTEQLAELRQRSDQITRILAEVDDQWMRTTPDHRWATTR